MSYISTTTMGQMKILELYAGSRSIGKVAEAAGHKVFSTDINSFDGIDLVEDILNIPIETFTNQGFDFIWASPPCTTFSVASIGHHWGPNQTPKTEAALIGIKLLERTIEIIKAVKPKIWYIENPRGMMRKMPQLTGVDRRTIWYCAYGDARAKPTDIWSNNFHSIFNEDGWQPRPECKNGNPECHHERAPRGAKTGTQGLKGNYDRSIIPPELCREIISLL